MRVFRSLRNPGLAARCALTIGNFDGVHRGHQAMLALLVSEATHRGLPATVLTFEPNPRDYFARRAGNPDAAPARIATLRDKVCELERCGVAQSVVVRFDAAFAAQSPEAFVADVLVNGLGAGYVLVGDDFRYGAKRAGDYAMLDAAGTRHGFDVARMMSYEVHGQRVSSSAVRAALAAGDMTAAAALLGRPYSISGRIVAGKRLGRSLGETSPGRGDGFRTLNIRFGHPKPAAMGIFVVRVHGLGDAALDGVASLGRRPTVDDSGRVLLEVHCFDWPRGLGLEGGYGKLVRVELLHKLRDEARYASLAELTAAIGRDAADARAFLAADAATHAATGRQTTRDRI
ncbi:MAG TPA: bifunctional riboflavin kinase/FAD synthetase [Caldimonas sp.]|jgi:riboflavin kinase/FMN adenylyltransferase|nr:bifunctional riboflavin kinase/FAD synthetase [Caldimonas sp.]HEX4234258.1 bifunctional riboflavin kinase/FAD synthetase [Caldimonas sp.]